MDTDLLSRTKRIETEREVAQLRLVAAARSASKEGPTAPTQRAVPSIPLRLLRALRLAS